jgi:hypothetical protein
MLRAAIRDRHARTQRYAGTPVLYPGKSTRRRALARSLNPQGIFFSRQYDSVLHFFRKSLVNPNLFAIIASPNGLSGFI